MARRRAVSMTERMPAWSLAPHSVRKPLVILRMAAQGRKARSGPLPAGGMPRMVTKTKKCRRIFLISGLPEPGTPGRKEIASLAGLAPWTRQSGR